MKQNSFSVKTSTGCLDAVKFFAACIVAFVWHYQHFEPSSGNPFGRIFAYSYPYGWLMVELFFMLSGFGMMVGYGTKILGHLISFPQYMRKRLDKIYPLFFVTLIIVTLLEFIFKAKTGDTFVYPNFDLYHLFLNIILCHDGLFVTDWSFNSPSWCISICFVLYVIFFAVCYHSKNEQTAVYKFVCLGIVGSMILNLGWYYPVLNALVARGLFCFSIGVVLAHFYQNEHLYNTKFIGYLCFTVLIGCYVAYRVKPSIIGNMQMIFILFIAPMIIISTIFVPWLNRLMSWNICSYLGSLSMEIYLFHFPVQCAIKLFELYYNLGLNYSSRKIWILYVASTIFVSILYKHLLEKRVTELYLKAYNSLIGCDHKGCG